MIDKAERKKVCEVFYGKNFVRNEDGEVACNYPNCGAKVKAGNGLTNLCNHITNKHLDWATVMATATHTGGNIEQFIVRNQSASNMYGWISYIVARNLPFSIVDDAETRAFTKLNSICYNTLEKYMGKLYDRV